jgi:hypothetical protein
MLHMFLSVMEAMPTTPHAFSCGFMCLRKHTRLCLYAAATREVVGAAQAVADVAQGVAEEVAQGATQAARGIVEVARGIASIFGGGRRLLL